MDSSHHQKPHAIFIPYPLQGHIIPSVHLAITLASRGFTVTFLNTQSIHHHTSKSSSSSSASAGDIFAAVSRDRGLDIRYATVSDGLPRDFDRSLHHDVFMAALLHVFSAHVEAVVAEIVAAPSGPPVSCLIADTFYVWPAKVAKKFGLKYVSFWTEPALVFSLYYHMDLLRRNGHFGCLDVREDPVDYIPGVRSINPADMMSYLQESDASTVCHQIIFNAFDDVKGADFILCNTIQELENETISALQAKMPFYSIGPTFPTGFTKSLVPTSLWSESDCTQWLDTRARGSVLYVSFGSYAHDTNPLPDGFEEEIQDRSIIVPWCCQIQVLNHPAIGGFLTHCGWNSILESIWCEVPFLCFPLLTDQFTNRKLVVDDWKIGINLCDKKRIMRAEVSNKVNRLMSKNSGEKYRKEIKEVKKKLENAIRDNGSSEMNLDQFIKDFKFSIQKQSGAILKQNLSSGT
ncbi:UDP-Glycosyltransferase superfamily protein [Actinidia rufa]|uniref:UDP-Glycosyltransferase superfamily protein n=1 Tax=Actinidia rufa TaxID=165716 RepID=A0A7J0GPV0_9ERIC|nr:UDP-Glycosyltransferase superfamily protein [Actinidia rufa]